MTLKNYNDSVEKSILSCIVQKPSLINECYLDPKHFLNDTNKKFYSFCRSFYRQTNNLNVALMSTKMKNKDKFIDYYMELIDIEPSCEVFYAYQDRQEEIYKEYAISNLIERLNNKEIDYNDLMHEITKIDAEFIKTTDKNKLSPDEIIELITTDKNNLEFKIFRNLQNKVNFLQNTVNIISARTSVGKTAFALNLLNDLAQTYKCLYFNMEMNEKEVYQRLIGINSDVPIEYFKNPTELQSKLMLESAQKIDRMKFKIVNGSKNIGTLRNMIIREQKEEHLIVFVDYIGYVYTKENQSDRERIGEVMRELQMLTKDYNVTIFVLAQINRDGNDEPTLINLKDSGELEQSAHVVMILHNPNKDDSNELPELKLMIPKNRNGKVGFIKIIFNKKIQKFIEI